jgi:diguanylate cyclase (GGDEF)-like protein
MPTMSAPTHSSASEYIEEPTENQRQYDALRADREHLVLRVITGPDAGEVIELSEGSYVLGRARGVDIRIDSAVASRVHARIICSGGSVQVEDLGSRNGTWYENVRLEGRQKLLDGQRISIGGTVLRLSRLDQQDLTTALALSDAARKDPLTNCFNRGYFDRRLALEAVRSHQNERSTSLVMLDLDHFKRINDQYGHTAGDAILRSVGHTLTAVTRMEDVVARYGGEEFAIILPGATTLGAALLAQRARSAIEQAVIEADGQQLRVTASFGVATLERGQRLSGHELVRGADEALYAAKRDGRNRVHIGSLGAPALDKRNSEAPVTMTEFSSRWTRCREVEPPGRHGRQTETFIASAVWRPWRPGGSFFRTPWI